MLDVADLVTAYGKIEALKGVSLRVESGRITCLLGPNGAGKTTLMMTIAGILKPRRGSIRLDGDELIGLTPAQDRRPGVALVPENRLVFPQMSVRENLLAGRLSAPRQGGDRRRHRAHVRALSAPAGAARAACRHALGRRAADARGRPRADVAAAPAADGRAVARPRAADRRGDLPHRRRAQPRRHHHLPGRAERAHGAAGRAPVLSDGAGARDVPRNARASSPRTR